MGVTFSKRFGARIVLFWFFSFFVLFSFQNCGSQFQVNTETADLASQSVLQMPSVTFESTTPTLINTPTHTLAFRLANVQDSEVRSITCQLNQMPVVDCSSRSLVLNQLVDGEHRVRIVVETVSGMIGETVRIFRKDSTAPVLTVAMAPLAVNNQTSASILVNATDNLSGVERFECAFNSEVYSLCTMPVNLTNLVAGNQNLKVRAYDRINNLSLVSEIIWTVNLTIPVVTISSYPAALTNQTTASLVFSGPTVVTYECSLDNAAFAACVSPVNLSNLTAGAHNFRVRGTSAAGNISMPAVANWSIELAAPTLAFSQMPSTLTNQTSATFAFSSPGSVTFECQLDTAAYAACTSPRTVTGLSAGAHVFRVRARSAAGNLSTPIMHSWSVDLAAPTVNLTSMPSVNTNQTSANFAFSGTGFVTYECQLDNAAYTACTSPRMLSGLSAGAHTFRVRGTNAAGNVSAPVQFVWNVELQASAIAFTQQPQPVVGSGSASFAFSGNNIASYECQLDSAAYVACTSPRVLSGLAPGAHTFRVRGVSLAGNISQAVSYNWTVELAPPTVTILSGPSNPTNQSTAVITFSGTNAARFECQLNSSAFSTCSSPHTIPNLVDRNYSFNIRAVSSSGLVSTNYSYNWSVDLTPPVAPVITLYPPTNSNLANFNFEFNFSGDPLECSLNRASYTACSSSFQATNLNQGNNVFQVRARDNAGNVSASADYFWIFDNRAPSTPAITHNLTGTVTSQTSVTFNFLSIDPGNGAVRYYCAIDGAVTPCTSTLTRQNLAAGNHNLSVSAIDDAGNFSTAASFSWRVTTINPNSVVLLRGTYNSTCAITAGGRAKCWGLQEGSSMDQGFDDVADVAIGHSHICLLFKNGTAKCRTNILNGNIFGAVGNGTTALTPNYVDVSGLSGMLSITAGNNFTCAVMGDRTVKCWGRYIWTETFPNITTYDSGVMLTPTTIAGITNADKIVSSGAAVCVLHTDARVSCWGSQSRSINYGSLTPTLQQIDSVKELISTRAALRTNNQIYQFTGDLAPVLISSFNQQAIISWTTGVAINSTGVATFSGVSFSYFPANSETSQPALPPIVNDVSYVVLSNGGYCFLTNSGGVKCVAVSGNRNLVDGRVTLTDITF